MKRRGIGAWASLALMCSAACTQVLGIEDARFDTSLRAGSGGTTAGTSATSGGGGSAPQSSHDHGSEGGEPTGTTPSEGGTPSEPSGGKAPTAGSEATTTGGDDGGTTMEPTLCEKYCDTVMTNCKGKYEQYRTFDQCVEVCKRLPPGSPGDQDVNTVECRIRQAESAASEGFLYCKSAGPLGAGKCGSNCVSYCSLMMATCTPESTKDNTEPSRYDSSQACLEACGAIPAHDGDPTQYTSSTTAEPSCMMGNTVYCRVYHLSSALGDNAADEHCPHAMGGDPCIEQ